MADSRSVLIAGVSVRALAESAARAGYAVTAVDAFGDLDLEQAAARVITVPRRFSADRAVRAAAGAACDATAYASGFENHPRAVAKLRGLGPLWGNRPEVLGRVRDPLRLARTLVERGFPAPRVRVARPPRIADTRWLLKPRASGGGHGIASWRPVPRGRRRLPRTMYLQERIPGLAGSIVFVADGRRSVPLGLSRALWGERCFGSSGFRYSGSILAGPGELPLAPAVALAAAVTDAFGLVGVNGIDFIARDSRVYALEVNPRYTASMELVERAYGLSIFDVHARACAGALPSFDLAAALASQRAVSGKAIVYARRITTIPDSRGWLAATDVRDIPRPGQVIARGRPVCTVFAEARNHETCLERLAGRAAALYRMIEAPARRIA
jgi:predicted ATP-grasp superfamily ATP-dependent carboligase